MARQRPGEAFRLAIIGDHPGAEVRQVFSVEEVQTLAAECGASSVVWDNNDQTFAATS